ncbi:MAG: isopentenyl-diphosphate delta-isomerase [Bacteriovoracaceae bacterium]|jgi:isopentenyl-diphosphate delta-isomerase
MDHDPSSEERKMAHINLAMESQISGVLKDKRFNYEPLFEAHPSENEGPKSINFLGKNLLAGLWISSMTGGTGPARHINQNLARGVGEFGLGMGLGSCRSLLESDKFFDDFNLRSLVKDQPLYANLGIAQIEKALEKGSWDRIERMVSSLKADGLIIHLNPMQEWFQPEGDLLKRSPLESIDKAIEKNSFPLIVKEVGQGMGPKSLKALMKRRLMAIEFGAFGGTNFSRLEQLRQKEEKGFRELALVGHTADEMVSYVNQILKEEKDILCKDIIISGGVQNALHGHHLVQTCEANSVYGQAKAMLLAAKGDYKTFQTFLRNQIEGLSMMEKYLTSGAKSE